MAKAKAKSKAKSNSTKSKSNLRLKGGKKLPEGYKVIARAPNWDPEKDPVIEGVRGETREFTVKKGTPDEYDARTFVLEDETLGHITVWESAMLKDMFEATEDGDVVRIEFLGLDKPRKKGESGAKLFACSVKE